MLAVEPALRTCENFPTAYMRVPHWTICRTFSTLPDGPVSTSWGVAAGAEDTAAPATPDGTVRNPKSRVAASVVTKRNRMSWPPQGVGSWDWQPAAAARPFPQARLRSAPNATCSLRHICHMRQAVASAWSEFRTAFGRLMVPPERGAKADPAG